MLDGLGEHRTAFEHRRLLDTQINFKSFERRPSPYRDIAVEARARRQACLGNCLDVAWLHHRHGMFLLPVVHVAPYGTPVRGKDIRCMRIPKTEVSTDKDGPIVPLKEVSDSSFRLALSDKYAPDCGSTPGLRLEVGGIVTYPLSSFVHMWLLFICLAGCHITLNACMRQCCTRPISKLRYSELVRVTRSISASWRQK